MGITKELVDTEDVCLVPCFGAAARAVNPYIIQKRDHYMNGIGKGKQTRNQGKRWRQPVDERLNRFSPLLVEGLIDQDKIRRSQVIDSGKVHVAANLHMISSLS